MLKIQQKNNCKLKEINELILIISSQFTQQKKTLYNVHLSVD